jgi:hypothetical protein
MAETLSPAYLDANFSYVGADIHRRKLPSGTSGIDRPVLLALSKQFKLRKSIEFLKYPVQTATTLFPGQIHLQICMKVRPGLPDGFFSNQPPKFGQILEDIRW